MIGENIKKARKKRGMTQEELALQIGVTAQAVSRWESGAGMPDISMVVPLARILEISTDTLFGFEAEDQDDAQFMEYQRTRDQIDRDYPDPKEAALKRAQYAAELAERNPGNFVCGSCLAEACANLSRYVDFDNFAREEWEKLRSKAILAGTQVIRFCKNPEWVEKTHFSLAWIYIHEKDYSSARDHIQMLPSIAHNRLQEGLLSALTFFEEGFEGMKPVVVRELQMFTRALSKEFLYSMKNYAWNGEAGEAAEYGEWCIRVMKTLSERKENLPLCRGFTRDIYTHILLADLRCEDFDAARRHWKELEESMQEHLEYYREVLADEEMCRKYDERQREYMSLYTPEFVRERKDAILALLTKWQGEEKVREIFAATP